MGRINVPQQAETLGYQNMYHQNTKGIIKFLKPKDIAWCSAKEIGKASVPCDAVRSSKEDRAQVPEQLLRWHITGKRMPRCFYLN